MGLAMTIVLVIFFTVAFVIGAYVLCFSTERYCGTSTRNYGPNTPAVFRPGNNDGIYVIDPRTIPRRPIDGLDYVEPISSAPPTALPTSPPTFLPISGTASVNGNQTQDSLPPISRKICQVIP